MSAVLKTERSAKEDANIKPPRIKGSFLYSKILFNNVVMLSPS